MMITKPSCGKVGTSHRALIANRGDIQNSADMAGQSHSCADQSTPCIPGLQRPVKSLVTCSIPKSGCGDCTSIGPYRGFIKWGYPQFSSISIDGIFHHPAMGVPHFPSWKPSSPGRKGLVKAGAWKLREVRQNLWKPGPGNLIEH